MALNNLGLGFLFTAKDLASGVMRRVRGSFNSVSTAATKGFGQMDQAARVASAGLAIFGVGLGIIAGGFAAANRFGEFEQKMAAVQAVTKASAEQLDKLSEAALQAGIATQFSPTEATEGLLSLATAGQTATQATETLIPVLDLAAGSLGQLGVAQAAEAVVGTLNAYGKSADQAADVTDRLLRITQLTNFQTRDFEGGLAKAAAAGAVFNQDLNDVLITVGLLRNRNIEASSAATAFREATRRLGADQRAQSAITAQGVEIFDEATGKMRSIVDITLDLAEATESLTDEERNKAVVQGFGARGLLAFNAIQKASFTQQKDGRTITLKGRDAIAALRMEMDDTAGTAQGFRDALLDTFTGQKTLIKGSLETLGVVAGEGFASTFRPMITLMIKGINLLIKVVRAIPTPVKQFIAALVTLAGVFLAVAGSTLFLVAAGALLLPALKVIAIAIGVVAIAFLPLILAIGAGALAFVAFKVAFEDAVGGIAGAGKNFFEPVRLAFSAITQLLKQGGFSGAIRDEMQKAENEGLRDFVIGVAVLVTRIQNFFDGIVGGFRATIKENKPVFDEFFNTLRMLGTTLSQLFGSNAASENAEQWQRWGEIGLNVGSMIGGVAIFIIRAMTFILRKIELVTFAFNFLGNILESSLGPAFESASAGLDSLSEALGEMLGPLDLASGGFGFIDAAILGFNILAFIIQNVISTLTFFAGIATAAIRIVTAEVTFLFNHFRLVGLFIKNVFTGNFREAASNAKEAFGNLAIFVIRMAKAMAGALSTVIDKIAIVAGGTGTAAKTSDKFFDNLIGKVAGRTGAGGEQGQKALFRLSGGRDLPDAEGESGDAHKNFESFFGVAPLSGPEGSPAVAEAKVRSGKRGNEDMVAQLASMNEMLANLEGRPILVNSVVKIDGAVLGESVREGQRGSDATGFSPGAGPQE